MSTKRSLVVGSTGLVGEMLVRQLASDKNYVKALSRNELSYSDPLVDHIKVDFENLDLYQEHFKEVDEVYICLGTTISKAGSKEAFEKVDIDYCLDTAKQADRKSVV